MPQVDAANCPPPPHTPTKIVNLYKNPATPVEALGVARNIVEGNIEKIKGTIQEWPYSRVEKGNWGGVQFLSPYLCEEYFRLCAGGRFIASQLQEIVNVGPSGKDTTTKIFRRTDIPDENARIALWFHKTDVTQKMLAQGDSYIKPMKSKERQAAKLWDLRGRLFIAIRINLPTIRCMSVRLNEKVIGASWALCRPKSEWSKIMGEDIIEKALCVYFNSTIGILAILGGRTNRKPTYPRMSVRDLRRIPVPDFDSLSESQVSALATAYDTLCNFTLQPLPLMEHCETRQAIDRVVARALDIAPETLASIRRELCREPSVTGKPYE